VFTRAGHLKRISSCYGKPIFKEGEVDMADYAACDGAECPLKGTCARYLMKPERRQTYLVPTVTGEDCGSYWNVFTGVPFPINQLELTTSGQKAEGKAG
tara:strand:+ start:1219 stop:1515 length:297 start_codon:yes stop_codon:yes gene_type:complete